MAGIHPSTKTNQTPAYLPVVPTTKRDNQAIAAVKAAIGKPKTRDFPLIECEFPPLVALNKMGDGSMRSANEVDQVSHYYGANL